MERLKFWGNVLGRATETKNVTSLQTDGVTGKI